MRRLLALLLLAALALGPDACKPQSHGAVRVVVIGGQPQLRDPALGPFPESDAVLLENVAQGLVRFDASGNIVPGLAERWSVSDDGLSYIFRIASAEWPDGRKITGEQVAKILKHQLGEKSRNEFKDAVGAIEDVVAMTDRVVEIQLVAPRPNLLSILAQPQFSILRGNAGTGPFRAFPAIGPGGAVRLTREILAGDDEQTRHEEVLLSGASSAEAIAGFLASRSDLVLGGTFADLPLTRRAKIGGANLRFDPASGLFGLVPTKAGGPLDNPDVRHLLSQAIDRTNFVGGLGVPGLAPRASLLEPGLDGVPAVSAPDWFAIPLAERLTGLRAQADKLFGPTKPHVRIAMPDGPGVDFLFGELKRDWAAIGLTAERVQNAEAADFVLLDEVAPSSSPAWFVRHFRCGTAAVCDSQADQLMDAARQMPVPAQRYALLVEAAARIDDAQLFIPVTAPVRWSLVSGRVQNFAGNRYARHTLTDLEQASAGN
ncbi:MAG TPA: ABC transporter substrate-binding protein [Sphingomicrobium sp.]|nr:ABC transporter substrate-binding protein [Sphingomicrobium sp.]